MVKTKISARSAAYESLIRCERDKRYSNLEIDSAIKKYRLEGAERGLYTTLVYGVIERRMTIDYLIGKLSSKPFEKLDSEVITLLRLGFYQLIWLDRIPESAAVNESVELAKKYAPRSASFINAVLRQSVRKFDKSSLPYPDKSNRVKYLSVRYSSGEDVVRTLDRYADAEAILAAFEKQPEITLRVNTLKISREELITRLAEGGTEAYPTELSDFGVKIKYHSIPEIIEELILSGYVYIQDEASQLALIAADPKKGDSVIDVCACPGGKSFSAAIMMENCGEVKSFDLHKNKLSLVDAGAKRLGLSIIKTFEGNGSVYNSCLDSSADLVICDVPCSGLGVIAKKPELRYKSSGEYGRLPEIQYSILSNAANYAKLGGTLTYSTCTLNPDENENVIKRFLESDDRYQPIDFAFGDVKSENGCLTLFPHINKTDGFFISKFRRIK